MNLQYFRIKDLGYIHRIFDTLGNVYFVQCYEFFIHLLIRCTLRQGK